MCIKNCTVVAFLSFETCKKENKKLLLQEPKMPPQTIKNSRIFPITDPHLIARKPRMIPPVNDKPIRQNHEEFSLNQPRILSGV